MNRADAAWTGVRFPHSAQRRHSLSHGSKFLCIRMMTQIDELASECTSPRESMSPGRAILIVDDDSSVRVMLTRLVQSAGCTPPATATGSEGFTRLIEHADRIALIFVDLRMPDMDGYGFRSRQLESPDMAVIPTVVMSGQV